MADDQHRYLHLAREAILGLLDREHAVVWHEIEAKLAERPRVGAPRGINPHHLSNARRLLLGQGLITEETAATRGGRQITVYGLQDRQRRGTAYVKSAQRKRLLETRYRSWAEGTGGTISVVGAAGELVSRASLRAAAPAGYRVFTPAGTRIAQILGTPIVGGPLDDAAQVIAHTDEAEAIVTLPIEVKNLRPWIYPSTAELYQLLSKAAHFQLAHPHRLVMPLLVCRRVQYLTLVMAKHLGFFVVRFDHAAQPILRHHTVGEEELREVREELGYVLAPVDGPLPGVTRQFAQTVPNQALTFARRWQRMAPALSPCFDRLRDPALVGPDREEEMDTLYRTATGIEIPSKPWRRLSR